jgi:hypothetical protein
MLDAQLRRRDRNNGLAESSPRLGDRALFEHLGEVDACLIWLHVLSIPDWARFDSLGRPGSGILWESRSSSVGGHCRALSQATSAITG